MSSSRCYLFLGIGTRKIAAILLMPGLMVGMAIDVRIRAGARRADTSGVRLDKSNAPIRRPDVRDHDATGRLVKRSPLKYWLLVALLSTSCSPIRACVSTTFDLAADSRLPGWFAIPAGRSRNDLRVTVTYYPPLLPSATVLELLDSNGRAIAHANGRMCWHPAMHDKLNEYGGLNPDSYPHWVIVTVNGLTEVLEHRYSSQFRVVDDVTLVAQAKESVSKGECRKEPS